MDIHHYSVFAAAPGGGKHVAIVEGVDNPVDMGRTATQSGAPLTGFILSSGQGQAEVRFFSSPRQGEVREKGSSDSGALVVGEHLRRQGAIGDRLTVQMGEEGLEVFYQDEKWWSEQEDTWAHKLELDSAQLLEVLGLCQDDVVGVIRAAGGHKINLVVSVKSVVVLDNIGPSFEALSIIQKSNKVNGVIAVCLDSPRAAVDFRWFSPAKNLNEDNAGSYTLASLCGYLTGVQNLHGERHLEAIQGFASGKPSRLYVRYLSENSRAKNIRVGGQVEMLEVTKWA